MDFLKRLYYTRELEHFATATNTPQLLSLVEPFLEAVEDDVMKVIENVVRFQPHEREKVKRYWEFIIKQGDKHVQQNEQQL